MDRRWWRSPAIVFAIALAASAWAAGEDGIDPDSDDHRDAWVLPDKMGGIYAEHCAVCHGSSLEGAAQGPALMGPLTRGEFIFI